MKPSAYSKEYAELRSWLELKREAKGLSIRAVAEILQRHHFVIRKLEKNRRRIDIIAPIEHGRVVDAPPHEAITC